MNKKTIGFVKSDKAYEKRIALLPEDLVKIKNCKQIAIENGYGSTNEILDEEYQKFGVQVMSRAEVLKCDIICDPKIGEAHYLNNLNKGTILFGWIHAVEHRSLTDLLIEKEFTCYAWEDMFQDNRHVFWKNNFIAGESAVLHALQSHGISPKNRKAAIIGRGNSAMGANQILASLGCEVSFFNRRMEALLRKEIHLYDIVVNAVLWDHHRKDHILSHEDLKHMKKGALLIDVSIDEDGAIEGARATTIAHPTYKMDGVTVYAVNNTPSLLYRDASKVISNLVADYVDMLVEGNTETMNECKILDKGIIYDQKIVEFQNR